MIGNKVLTVCEYGNSRSVGCAFMLKEKYGKDAIACGIRRANPDTFDMLCEWADSIVITVGHLRPEINPKYNDKVLLWDVGHDRYFIPPVPELLEQYESYYSQLTTIEKKTELIPRKVYTAWFGETMPPLITKCINSQIRMCNEFGYEHHLITNKNLELGFADRYIRECLDSKHETKKWVKLTDYCRLVYLFKYGGWFLDADVEIVAGRNFDSLLDEQMVIGKETNGEDGRVVLGMAVIGSTPRHPFLNRLQGEVASRFRGDDDLCYESSMELLNTIGVEYQDKFKLVEPEVFYPYEWLHTGKTTITENTIAIHHFVRSWTPEVNKKSTLQQFKYNIENNINFTFVKRGDGELACMRGDAGGNCDGHPYSKELGEKLWEAYEYLGKQPNTTIVEFDDQKNYNVLLHRTDSNLKEVSEFYKAIKLSKRNKYLIAPEKLNLIAGLLDATHIVIPELNLFSRYNEYKDAIHHTSYQSGWRDSIFIFCAGMPAKPLISDMMKHSPNATYLDCGSAFDPSVGITRTEQITKEQFWELYKEESWWEQQEKIATENLEKLGVDAIMAGIPTVNNFNLPQESHPERLWAIANIGDVKDKVIYDLGCGTFKTIPEARGMDVRAVTDLCGDIHSLNAWNYYVESNSVDVIISKHSFEHLVDPAKAMKEWIRVLKPGGKMVIVLPDHEFINTLDPYYSAGQHFHAYTRETFANFISLFPELAIAKQETVLENWSFGTVIYKMPEILIMIPHIENTREEGLLKCISSIMKQGYPGELFDVAIRAGNETVPEKIDKLVKGDKKYDYYVYAANDMIFQPGSLRTAIIESITLNKGLVSFNEGPVYPDLGNINTHFVIRRDLIDKLQDHQIFHLDFKHYGCDNFLYQQCNNMGQFYHSEAAKITHNHFTKGANFDEVYEKANSTREQDVETLKKKMSTLNS